MATVIRVLIIYVFVVAALRVMGKREFSQLSPLELVTLLLIPELTSQAIVGEDFSMTNAIIALSALFSLVFVTALLRFHFGQLNRVIEGTPSVLAHDGKMYRDNLELERVSEGEIYAEMHKNGLVDLSEVQWVIIEADGRIAVVPKSGRTRPPDEEPVM